MAIKPEGGGQFSFHLHPIPYKEKKNTYDEFGFKLGLKCCRWIIPEELFHQNSRFVFNK